MKINSRLFFPGLLIAILFLSACGAKATATPTMVPATPDPCAPENIAAEVQKVHTLMREFDDASQLASVAPLSQMATVIPPLQDIRRRAEDQQAPPCLSTLKTYQLQHMNVVINTLLAFMQNGGKAPDVLVQGIAQARTLHEQYNMELARLIGATYVPPAPQPTASQGTPAEPTVTPASALAKNEGTAPVNIRSKPSLDAPTVGTLEANLSIVAVGKTDDGQWIQVTDQAGNTAWIYASLVTIVGGEALPVVTPAP